MYLSNILYGQMDGRTDGRTDGRMDGRMDGQTGRYDGLQTIDSNPHIDGGKWDAKRKSTSPYTHRDARRPILSALSFLSLQPHRTVLPSDLHSSSTWEPLAKSVRRRRPVVAQQQPAASSSSEVTPARTISECAILDCTQYIP